MNIKEAKEQIKNAMIAYFTKDETGEYVVPVERQRPVFLMGCLLYTSPSPRDRG